MGVNRLIEEAADLCAEKMARFPRPFGDRQVDSFSTNLTGRMFSLCTSLPLIWSISN